MTDAGAPGRSALGGCDQADPEAVLHGQARQAGRIVQAVAFLVGGVLIFAAAVPAGLAGLGLAAAILSTLASMSLVARNLQPTTLSGLTQTGSPARSWLSVTSLILTLVAAAVDVITVALLLTIR
ncbi:hypothetical protein [Subtercola vilae]|uniref:Uncharacterized protein n=1 Tax=Subtercola vilae TaxID=2056433 RepID=A0A4V4RF24_9MICO|nr:hypothetical protein [Subtercola vilae]TIH36174.1 hypothetical protein D4765_10390 [Subtercola vilae]